MAKPITWNKEFTAIPHQEGIASYRLAVDARDCSPFSANSFLLGQVMERETGKEAHTKKDIYS